MEKTQMVVVVGVILNEDGCVLLQKRIDPHIPDADGKWELPGGRVEFGEDPMQAIVREIKEETACETAVIRLLPSIQSRIWRLQNGTERHVIVCCYALKFVKGIPIPLDKKVSEIRWFAKQEIEKLDVLPGTMDCISMTLDSIDVTKT